MDSICSGKTSPESLTEMAIPRVRSSKALKVGMKFEKKKLWWFPADVQKVTCNLYKGYITGYILITAVYT